MTAVLPARAPAPAPAPRTHTTLDLGELVDLTRRVAADVRAGQHEIVLDPDERWHRRLFRDTRVDVWLIGWLPEQGTQLHDHGGSCGAFTVVSGTLDEAVWSSSPGRIREQRRAAGQTVAFGSHYVHDVRNLSPGAAVSVHAYSAPLSAMTFYDIERATVGDGAVLTPFATLDTDDPEAPVPTLPDRLR